MCANSKKSGEIIKLDNSYEVDQPYTIEIKTGCKKGVKRGRRFCNDCLAVFGGRDEVTGDVLFLESLHPRALGRIGGPEHVNERKIPGED